MSPGDFPTTQMKGQDQTTQNRSTRHLKEVCSIMPALLEQSDETTNVGLTQDSCPMPLLHCKQLRIDCKKNHYLEKFKSSTQGIGNIETTTPALINTEFT